MKIMGQFRYIFFFTAIEGSSSSVVHTLLTYGADPLLHDYSGNMPIDLAEGDIDMKRYMYNILADLHGRPPAVRGTRQDQARPAERWNVSHRPDFHDPEQDSRYVESMELMKAAKRREGEEEEGGLREFTFEVSNHPLPDTFQFLDRDGEYVLYNDLKEFAKKHGHGRVDIRAKGQLLDLPVCEFMKTSHSAMLDRRHVRCPKDSKENIVLVKVDKFVKKILNVDTVLV